MRRYYPKEVLDLAETTVRKWFEGAQHGKSWTNLWYEPNRLAWKKLAKPVVFKGVKTPLIEFEGRLYVTYDGPGDCEEILHHLGKCKS